MKVLVVCSDKSGGIAPFVAEQAECLKAQGVEIGFFAISQKGLFGYLKSRKALLQKINEFQPNAIHAHFGLCGLLANLQRKIPVVTTYHGCDINTKRLRAFSIISILLSKRNVFVSKKQVEQVRLFLKKYDVIPCGVDGDVFYPMSKTEARKKINFQQDKIYILFSSTFDRAEKNAELAQLAVELLNKEAELVELKGYSREQVAVLMNACDAGLLTSIREGSPMFVKEQIFCNRPTVSTDVGDVKETTHGVKGCFITSFDAQDVANALTKAIQCERAEPTEEYRNMFDNKLIAQKLITIYKSVLK